MVDSGEKKATGRRRRKASPGSVTSANEATDKLFASAPAQDVAADRERKELPELGTQFTLIREKVFTLTDENKLYNQLVDDLDLDEALTPGNLQTHLNRAEKNALNAHQLYVTARADYERFEAECLPILEGMRDAANKELQAEKDAKQRSKAITDTDVKGRASILFPDEWAAMNNRRLRAEGMLDQLKKLAHLWEQRCFSLGTMLNAGRRS